MIDNRKKLDYGFTTKDERLFGDTVNNVTGGEDFVNPQTVNFNYTEVKIVDAETGLPFRGQGNYWISNSDVEYELVLEVYDQEEHQFYKPNQFAN